MGISSPDTEARLTSAALSDSLDAVGVRHQVMHARVRPLAPGLRAVGRAATVQFAPTEADVHDPYGEMIAFIDGLKSGEIAILATGGHDRSAHWGELFSAAATGRGAVGVVCDGYLRDRSKIQRLAFPAFATGSRPIDYRARARVVDRDVPVTCGGVTVAPGDLVLADDDGVVVVPRAVEAEALARAASRVSGETTVLDELLAGASLRAVWDRHGLL